MIEASITLPRAGGLVGWLRRQISADARKAVAAVAPGVRERVSRAVRDGLKGHPTYGELRGGLLAVELGLGENESHKIDECVDYVSRSVRAEPKPPAGDLLGGVRVVMLSEGLSALAAEPFASYLSAGKRGVTTVPWLSWLLTGGERILLSDYQIRYVRPGRAPSSRTGQAVMVRGSGYTLFRAGVPGHNWVEDVLQEVAETTVATIETELRARIR